MTAAHRHRSRLSLDTRTRVLPAFCPDRPRQGSLQLLPFGPARPTLGRWLRERPGKLIHLDVKTPGRFDPPTRRTLGQAIAAPSVQAGWRGAAPPRPQGAAPAGHPPYRPRPCPPKTKDAEHFTRPLLRDRAHGRANPRANASNADLPRLLDRSNPRPHAARTRLPPNQRVNSRMRPHTRRAAPRPSRRVIATPAQPDTPVSTPPHTVSVATMVQCQSRKMAQLVNSNVP